MEIELTGRYKTTIDDEDFGKIANHKWHVYINRAKNTKYAAANIKTNGKKTTIRMHRLIMDAKPGEFVDHINMNGLDNRKSNLRLSTRQGNSANRKSYRGSSSKYKGVTSHRGKRWRAQINVGGNVRHLGSFMEQEYAARAYDIAALEAFGEFARVNFPEDIWTEEQIGGLKTKK